MVKHEKIVDTILKYENSGLAAQNENKNEAVDYCMAIAEIFDEDEQATGCAVEPTCPSVENSACGNENNYIRDDVSELAVSTVDKRREANKLAGEILRAQDKSARVSRSQICKVLMTWRCAKNRTRGKVRPDGG